MVAHHLPENKACLEMKAPQQSVSQLVSLPVSQIGDKRASRQAGRQAGKASRQAGRQGKQAGRQGKQTGRQVDRQAGSR